MPELTSLQVVPVITGDTWFLVVALAVVAVATVIAWWPRPKPPAPCRVVRHPSGAAVCYEHSRRWGYGGHCPDAP